jgi:MFS family permease
MYVSLRDRPAGKGKAPAVMPRIATTVILLGIVSLLTDVSSEMINAVLPQYLTAAVGLSLVAYGFLDGLYQGVSAFVRIAGGYAADRYQHPKWIAVIGYGVSAITRILMLPVHTFAGITAVISADRLGKGLRTGPRDALIADVSDPRALGRAFGVHRMLDTVGAAAGPVLAFTILALVADKYTPTASDYAPIFVVSFLVALVGLAVLILLVPNRRTAGESTGIGLRRLARQISTPRLRKPLLAAGLLAVLTIGDGFLYLSLQDRDNLAAQYFPLLYVGTNVAYLLLAIPMGRLADRIGRARVFVGGHVALLATYLLASAPLGGHAATVATIGSLLLLGVFYAATDGVLPALLTRLTPPGARGSGIAAGQTVVVIARFASSALFGILWTAIGRSPALLVVTGLITVAIPVAAWLILPSDRGDGEDGADIPAQRDPDPTDATVTA